LIRGRGGFTGFLLSIRDVELLPDGAAFEVEFSDRNGRTYESVGLHPEQIMVLYFEPASPDIKPEMVRA